MSFFQSSKMIFQRATEHSQGKQCRRSDAPCQSCNHSAQRTQKYKFDRFLLKLIAGWTSFHHHWYLSSIWFFMVLTLRSQVSSWSYHLLVATVQQLPTRAALVEHRLLSALHIRLVTAGPSLVLPSPQEGGWTLYEGIWKKSLWTTLRDVTKSCRELVQCRCEKGCQGR